LGVFDDGVVFDLDFWGFISLLNQYSKLISGTSNE